jgi:hypothetical protein
MLLPARTTGGNTMHRRQRQKRVERGAIGTFSSKTMMVMMIATTPSLNASNLPLPIGFSPNDRV